MVAALMSEKNEWKQERQFAKRSEALKPYDESQSDLFNEAECEAAKEEEVEVTTITTTKNVNLCLRPYLVRLSNSI